MTSLVPIGFYSGLVTADLAGQLSTMTHVLGRAPTITNIGVDQTQSKSMFTTNAAWSTGALIASGTGLIPAFGLPLGSTADNDTAAIFPQIAAGKFDSMYSAIFQRLKSFPSGYLRIGWEQNGNWYPWSVKTASDADQFKLAFQHIVTLARSELPAGWKMEWNPATVYRGVIDTKLSYPGDAYVDVIGHDAYSDSYPYAGGQWKSDPNTGWDIPQAIAFAKQHGKPFALAEAGAGAAAGSAAAYDDPAFVSYLGQQLAGVQTAYVTVWENPWSYNFTTGLRPLEAKAWAQLATTATEPATIASAPSGTGNISGQVKINSVGYPMAVGVTLTLTDLNGNPYANTTSVSATGFSFGNLASGTYRIRVGSQVLSAPFVVSGGKTWGVIRLPA